MEEAPNSGALPQEISELERQTIARVGRRLLPLLMACYFVAYLDRVNVGFASLTMNKALHFSSAVYGFGGGIFFLGYFIFEVPSNVLLSKVGARRWIAPAFVAMHLSWGIGFWQQLGRRALRSAVRPGGGLCRSRTARRVRTDRPLARPSAGSRVRSCRPLPLEAGECGEGRLLRFNVFHAL